MHLLASILTTAILRELGVPYVMARAQTALHARVLARVGAHRVIFPERDMGMRVADHFVFPWLSQFSQVPGSELLVGKTAPRKEMVGKSLMELNFRNEYNAVVLLVDRQGEQFIPRADMLSRRRINFSSPAEAMRSTNGSTASRKLKEAD